MEKRRGKSEGGNRNSFNAKLEHTGLRVLFPKSLRKFCYIDESLKVVFNLLLVNQGHSGHGSVG